MKLFRRTMAEDEFWALIALLEGSTSEAAIAHLSQVLSQRGRRHARAFHERLAATLFLLDREGLFRQPVRWADDPDDAPPIPLSDDTFLYLRADIVAQGRDVVERVLSDPTTVLDRRWNDGEALLYAAIDLVGHDYETQVSYETASNVDQWSPVVAQPAFTPRPLVSVELADLLQPLEGYEDEAMTVPVSPVMHAWPMWFPMPVLQRVGQAVDDLVRARGGIHASMDVEQIQVTVGLGEHWAMDPVVQRQVTDETGLGVVTRVRVDLEQGDVRPLSDDDLEVTLRAVVASALLAVLPPEHDARPALGELVQEGNTFMPDID